jgi:hypothetical protein
MTKGYLIFAENTEHVDYVSIAEINAALIRRYSDSRICLVTNEKITSKLFDDVIVMCSSAPNKRSVNVNGKREMVPYYNSNRAGVYNISPYDQTIMVDADYFLYSKVLEQCWDIQSPLLINKHATTLTGNSLLPGDVMLEDKTIPMYWATCVYFNRSSYCEHFFKLVEHVAQNYIYYFKLYNVPANYYRNDYAYSIALHMYNDFQILDNNKLPGGPLLTSYFNDQVTNVHSTGMTIFSQYHNTYLPVVTSDTNIHVMNKQSLMQHIDKLRELYV